MNKRTTERAVLLIESFLVGTGSAVGGTGSGVAVVSE